MVRQSLNSPRRKRKPVNCEQCRRSKLKCDRQHPCTTCKRRKRENSCIYEPISNDTPKEDQRRSRSVLSRSKPGRVGAPLSPLGQSNLSASSQRHNQSLTSSRSESPSEDQWETVLERPAPEDGTQDTLTPLSTGPRMTVQDLINHLPPKASCDFLISHFFQIIHPLFPILHGPTFQDQYAAFFTSQPRQVDLPWLALLFSMCSLSLNTMDASDPRLAYFWPELSNNPAQDFTTTSLSRRLLQAAMTCLLQDQFFIRHKFSTFEALLMLIYNLSHNESVDQGWALLGMALNMGIALRCNMGSRGLNAIETERRRRCWAGLLTLHTYQGILFRDVDMSFLLEIKATMPADVNDIDITPEGISEPSGQPTQMSVMMAKIRLFRLSTHICRYISSPTRSDHKSLQRFNSTIAEEQERWDSTYMVGKSPIILDPTSYAFWCILQSYAHHLYLLLHRPFHHTKGPVFLPESRERCITSATAVISIHQQIYEAPLLRSFLWLLNGVISLKALHAAVALNSCLLDTPSVDTKPYREVIEGLAQRMETLSGRSSICSKSFRILRHLQNQSGAGVSQSQNSEINSEHAMEDWTDIREWMDLDLVNWNLEGAFSIFAD
ncbi:hypothetical protein N7450_000054 [Penicillium hetheringtonii]|uniref:Zn(2)-C6 fungal-type domain-containing protein n=1 Tax=Penicillium hetheringtonii TaxID=911720 RepID=A0AAD6E1X0_9EURO|nr:hypothetical protein N7450_000054 [Penicillium hetheringtonii]